MSAENQEQDFEKLQQLLKLKRHESPPPRFFNDFSFQVTARIRAGERKIEDFEDVVAQAPWLHRLWKTIEGKPAVSGLFAATVCAVLIAGIFFMDNTVPTLPGVAGNQTEAPAGKSEGAVSESLLAGASESGGSMSPTAVLPGSNPSLFNNVLAMPTTPVSFKPHALTNGFR